MNTSGFCRVECTSEQRDMVIAFRQRLLEDHEECQHRINTHDFDKAIIKRFLFFKWQKTIVDTHRIEAEYPDLFDYATTFDWDGSIGVYTTRSFKILSDMVRMFKTQGDIYLTPDQCTIFRRITEVAIVNNQSAGREQS